MATKKKEGEPVKKKTTAPADEGEFHLRDILHTELFT